MDIQLNRSTAIIYSHGSAAIIYHYLALVRQNAVTSPPLGIDAGGDQAHPEVTPTPQPCLKPLTRTPPSPGSRAPARCCSRVSFQPPVLFGACGRCPPVLFGACGRCRHQSGLGYAGFFMTRSSMVRSHPNPLPCLFLSAHWKVAGHCRCCFWDPVPSCLCSGWNGTTSCNLKASRRLDLRILGPFSRLTGNQIAPQKMPATYSPKGSMRFSMARFQIPYYISFTLRNEGMLHMLACCLSY